MQSLVSWSERQREIRQTEKAMWRWRQRLTWWGHRSRNAWQPPDWEARTGFSPKSLWWECGSADTLILDFRPPELQKNQVIVLIATFVTIDWNSHKRLIYWASDSATEKSRETFWYWFPTENRKEKNQQQIFYQEIIWTPDMIFWWSLLRTIDPGHTLLISSASPEKKNSW